MEWKSVCGTVSQHATAEAVLGHHRADWMIFWARVAQSWHAQNPERAVSVSRPINFQIVLHGGNYDENGDGELSMDEFRHLSNSLCTPCLLRVRACVRACVRARALSTADGWLCALLSAQHVRTRVRRFRFASFSTLFRIVHMSGFLDCSCQP